MTTSVQCPICGTQIFGEAESQLSANLQDHMTEVHELNLMGETRAGGLVGSSKTAEKILESTKKEAFEKEGGAPGGLRVRCPICAEEISAEDEEALSSLLGHHMINQHEVVRRLASWTSSR